MDFVPSWDLRSFLASTSAFIVAGAYAWRVKDRGLRDCLALAAFAVFPVFAWSLRNLLAPGTRHWEPPLGVVWYVWMLVGGIGLLSVVIDQRPVLARNALLPFVFIAFVGAWGNGCVQGCAAAASI